jgi:lipoyl-dependent peroxiredoxin
MTKASHSLRRIDTTAKVHIGDGPTTTLVELSTVGDVPGIDEKAFTKFAE